MQDRLSGLLAYQKLCHERDSVMFELKNTEAAKEAANCRIKLKKLTESRRAAEAKIDMLTRKIDSLMQRVSEIQLNAERELEEKDIIVDDEEAEIAEFKELNSNLKSLKVSIEQLRKELSEAVDALESERVEFKKIMTEGNKVHAEYKSLEVVCKKERSEKDDILNDIAKRTEEAAKNVSESDLETIKRLRKSYKVVIVPLDVGGLCGGCHISLPSSTVSDLEDGDVIIECENCGRLIYNRA